MAWASFPAGLTVTRHRPEVVGTDRYGDNAVEWVTTTFTELAAFNPGGSDEPVEVGRESVVTDPSLYFLEPVDLTERDEVTVSGRRYKINGRPAVYASPFGSSVGGTVVTLSEVEG